MSRGEAKPPKKSNPKKPNNKASVSQSQNGKGDSPRNISALFKENYDKINWSNKKNKNS